IPYLIKIGRLHVILCGSGDDLGLDLLLPELPEKLFSCLVEDEAAADLDLLLGPQLHLLEKAESHLCRLLEIQFLPEMRGLEVVDWDDVVVKLSSLLPVSANYGPEEKVSDTSIIYLNCHFLDTLPSCSCISNSSLVDDKDMLTVMGGKTPSQNCSKVFRPDPVAITTKLSFLSTIPVSCSSGMAAKAAALEGSAN